MEPLATPGATPDDRTDAATGDPPAPRPKKVRPKVPNPGKPWPDFPLTWHTKGYWQKKVEGRTWLFTADPIKSYDAFKERLREHAEGQATGPARPTARLTLADAKNAYLTRQSQRHADGEIGAVQMGKWVTELKRMLPKAIPMDTRLSALADERAAAGLFAQIRSAALARGLQAAERHICYVRAMLDWCASPKGGRMMRAPAYGDSFDKPTPDQIARQRNSRQDGAAATWTPAEAARLIREAAIRRGPHLYAQLVLAVVAGYTSADLAQLPIARIKRDLQLIDFPRVKNGRERLCLLTKPVLAAIDASLAKRPKPAEDRFAHLLFLSRRGTPINESKPRLDEHDRVVGTGRKDNLGLAVRRLCESIDRTDRAAWKKAGRRGEPPPELRRRGCGQKTFRSLNYQACVRAGVDKDFVALLRGRRFANPIEEYYLRGDLRDELAKLVNHLTSSFSIPLKPPTREPQHWPKSTYRGKPVRPKTQSSPRGPVQKGLG